MDDDRNSTPIVIVGTGRCGSTVLHRIMAEHPELSYLTNVLNRLPHRPEIHRLALKTRKMPIPTGGLKRRILPSEAWRFWEHIVPGISSLCRDLRADDVSEDKRDRIQRDLRLVTLSRAPRLLVKFTGWTRIGFIKEVLPDARIVHIIRDPRAVASSLLNVSWWHGWKGPHAWRWGELTSEEEAIWEESGQCFAVLALIEVARILKAYRESFKCLPDAFRTDIFEVRYDRLCESTSETIDQILEHCMLTSTREFERELKRFHLSSQDEKWKRELSSQQRAELETALSALGLDALLGGNRNYRAPKLLEEPS